MRIDCCDECGSVFGEIDDGQVMQVSVTVNVDDGLLSAHSPTVNRKRRFCSVECALKYLNACKKIEDTWIENWREGKILGKKRIVPISIRR